VVVAIGEDEVPARIEQEVVLAAADLAGSGTG
jgi:hypothetical protein